MRAIVVDDEPLALGNMETILKDFAEITEINTFSSVETILKWLDNHEADIAFLDIELGEMSGMYLARRLKEYCPDCAVVFVTGYAQYAVEAFQIHASGYLLKPVRKEDLKREILHAMKLKAWPIDREKRIRIQCFGNFEAFASELPLQFQYRKTKELLAYLVDRKGASCDINTLCAVLWEDKPDSLGLRSRLRHLISDLMGALKTEKSEDIMIRRRGSIAILPAKVDCDYYKWLNGDGTVANMYKGEYMVQYSWAEKINGVISNSLDRRQIGE